NPLVRDQSPAVQAGARGTALHGGRHDPGGLPEPRRPPGFPDREVRCAPARATPAFPGSGRQTVREPREFVPAPAELLPPAQGASAKDGIAKGSEPRLRPLQGVPRPFPLCKLHFREEVGCTDFGVGGVSRPDRRRHGFSLCERAHGRSRPIRARHRHRRRPHRGAAACVRGAAPRLRRNRAAIGYDMYTDPVGRDAMERARDGGSAAISGRVALVQEIDPRRQVGFLMYVPVYRGSDVPQTLEARRSSLIGWTYAPFRADDLFVAIFGMEAEPRLEFRVYDGPAEDPERLLHDRGLTAVSGETLRETEHIEFGGREWTLAFTALPPLRGGSLVPALATLLVGTGISIVIFVLSRREVAARRRAEDALAGLQHSLDEQRRYEVRLREEIGR